MVAALGSQAGDLGGSALALSAGVEDSASGSHAPNPKAIHKRATRLIRRRALGCKVQMLAGVDPGRNAVSVVVTGRALQRQDCLKAIRRQDSDRTRLRS